MSIRQPIYIQQIEKVYLSFGQMSSKRVASRGTSRGKAALPLNDLTNTEVENKQALGRQSPPPRAPTTGPVVDTAIRAKAGQRDALEGAEVREHLFEFDLARC